MMSTMQSNKEVIRKLYEQALNKRNVELLQEIVSEEYTGISGKKGVAGFEEPVFVLMKAFPDIQWKIEELMSEGNKVFVKWKVQGTHTGPFQHIAATDKTVANDGMAIYTLKEGKVINDQVHTDRLGFLQQLGELPSDLTLLTNKKAHPEPIRFIDKFLVPEKAKEAVQLEYKKQGFDPVAMFERLNITMDRGIYKEAILHS